MVITSGLGVGVTPALWCTSVTVLWGSMNLYRVGRGFGVVATDNSVRDGV